MIIISASVRVREHVPESTPSLERYDGIFAKLVRKYVREGLIDRRDVLIVSPTLGLIRGLEPVGEGAGALEDWHKPHIDPSRLQELNQKALRVLDEIAVSVRYSEAFVNVGRKLYPVIEGIDKVLPCEIVHAEGRGIGPKAAHMKAWILKR